MRVQPAEDLKELRLLYVEDEAEIRQSFTLMIKRYFKEVIVASNGKEGLELYERHHPDLVISDIRMPMMDGLSMAKEIKKIDPRAIIIFITAFNDSELLMEAIDLGVAGYLTKPIDRNKLFEILNLYAKSLVEERKSRAYFHLLELLFERYNDAIVLLKGTKILLANDTFRQLFGEVEECTTILERYQIEVDWEKERQIVSLQKDGEVFYYELFLRKVEEYMILSLQDVTYLQEEIIKDSLTGLYNRKIVPQVLRNKERYCLMVIDIDHFKEVNDTYGHDAGDKVLQELAQILSSSLRRDDVITRWGGEEFVVILDGVLNREIAQRIGEYVRKKIEEFHFCCVDHVTASIGIACGGDFDDTFKRADEALYRAKEGGRNRVEVG